MKIIGATILLLITAFVLTSCNKTATPTPDDPLADRSFLTDDPCAASCWYNLYVGISTEDDVLETVRQLSFIAPNPPLEGTTGYDGEDAKDIFFNCLSQSGIRPGCITFTISQEELKKIRISVGYHLTFKMAVDHLGNPDYVSYFVQPGETIACTTSIIWQDKGIYAYTYQKQACPTQQKIDLGVKLDPNIEVTNLLYYIPSDYPDPCGSCIAWRGFDEP